MSSATSEPADSLAAALGRVPSGLFILTTGHGARATGMLVSWVQQCSFVPPQVSIAIRKDRELHDSLAAGARLVLNIIPEGGKAFIAHFGKSSTSGESAFEGLAMRCDDRMPPILLDAHAYLTGRVVDHVDAGDHTLLIARVDSGAMLHDGKPTVHLRKNGLKY